MHINSKTVVANNNNGNNCIGGGGGGGRVGEFQNIVKSIHYYF